MKILAPGDIYMAGGCRTRLSPAGQADVVVLKRDLTNSESGAAADQAGQPAHALLETPTAVAKNKIPLILVGHTPAIGTRVDRLPSTAFIESPLSRKFIDDTQPDQWRRAGNRYRKLGASSPTA